MDQPEDLIEKGAVSVANRRGNSGPDGVGRSNDEEQDGDQTVVLLDGLPHRLPRVAFRPFFLWIAATSLTAAIWLRSAEGFSTLAWVVFVVPSALAAVIGFRCARAQVGATLVIMRQTRRRWTIHLSIDRRRLESCHRKTSYGLIRQMERDLAAIDLQAPSKMPSGSRLEMDTWLVRSQGQRARISAAGWQQEPVRRLTAVLEGWTLRPAERRIHRRLGTAKRRHRRPQTFLRYTKVL